MKTTVTGIPGDVLHIEAEHPDLKNYDYPELMAALGTLSPCHGTVTTTSLPLIMMTGQSLAALLKEIAQIDMGDET